jgi:hypothetical protein
MTIIHYGKLTEEPCMAENWLLTFIRNQPCKCCLCDAAFPSWQIAAEQHPYCYYWSCSFLPSADCAFYGYHDQRITCCFCDDLDTEHQVEAWRLPEARLQHLERHNFRMCNQQRYSNYDAFFLHLYEGHRLQRDPDSIEILALRGACSKHCLSTFKPYEGAFPKSWTLPTRPVATPAPQAARHRRTKSRGSRVIEKFASVLLRSPRR